MMMMSFIVLKETKLCSKRIEGCRRGPWPFHKHTSFLLTFLTGWWLSGFVTGFHLNVLFPPSAPCPLHIPLVLPRLGPAAWARRQALPIREVVSLFTYIISISLLRYSSFQPNSSQRLSRTRADCTPTAPTWPSDDPPNPLRSSVDTGAGGEERERERERDRIEAEPLPSLQWLQILVRDDISGSRDSRTKVGVRGYSGVIEFRKRLVVYISAQAFKLVERL